MWEYHTDEERGWKYSATSDRFIIQTTGGSVLIWDRQTQTLLKQYKGHHYLYTCDISPDETQCFALENGKHFYVYSLENYALFKRVTLPRGYECIDMYGHYTEDGTQIHIPAYKWIGNETTSEGYYEYVMCRYDAQQLTLIEKVVIEDPDPYRWIVNEQQLTFDESEEELLQKFIDTVGTNLEDEVFMDRMLGVKEIDEDDPVVAKIMKMVSNAFDKYFGGQGNKTEENIPD